MKTVVAKLYEGMFLVDSALAASDFEGVNNTIRGILEKAGAEIVSMKKWDDRRLEYEIQGKSRGTYILVFFKVDGTKITAIERSVQLSEQIMRVLILNVDEMDEGYVEKDTPATAAEKRSQAAEKQAAESAAKAEAASAEKPAETSDENQAEPAEDKQDESALDNKDEPDKADEQAEPDQKQQ